MELIPGHMYNIKYKMVGNRGAIILDYKVKIIEKSDDSIKVELSGEGLDGIIKIMKRNKIIEANPVIGGGRRKGSRKSRKSTRKSRKSRKVSRK